MRRSYVYAPAESNRSIPRLGLDRPGVCDLDIDSADLDDINRRVPGIDGAPCLVAVDAAAEFIAAVSEPTPLNPETPPAAEPASAGPVKRARGKKG